jgi:hypothetical protein
VWCGHGAGTEGVPGRRERERLGPRAGVGRRDANRGDDPVACSRFFIRRRLIEVRVLDRAGRGLEGAAARGRRRGRRRSRREPHALENPPRDRGVLDRGEEPQRRPAARAAQGVDVEDALEERGPSGPSRGSGGSPSAVRDRGRTLRHGFGIARDGLGSGRGGGGHDLAALAGTGCEDPMVPHLVGARRGDQGDEPVDQLASLHQDVRRAVAPGGLEAQGQPAIGLLLEAIVRERRPRGVVTSCGPRIGSFSCVLGQRPIRRFRSSTDVVPR